MFGITMFCLGVVMAAMMLILFCLVYVIGLDIMDEWSSEAADAAWNIMKYSAFGVIAAICLLALSWLIYVVVLIISQL